MKRNKLLIITSRADEHADYVIDILNTTNRGQSVVRLNTEDFATNCKVSFVGGRFDCRLKDSGRCFTSEEIHAVWFRRPLEIDVSVFQDKTVADFVKNQTNAVLRGLYFCLHDSCLWVNPLPALHRSRIKLQQLELAQRLGLRTPDTLVTNQPEAAAEFVHAHWKVCTKSLDEPSYNEGGAFQPLFTRLIERPSEILDNPERIACCPLLLQEYIDKMSDVRIVVFGDQLFAFEIFSQENPLSVVDFRGVVPDRLRHETILLPTDVEVRLRQFIQRQGLVFAAIDMVRSKRNQFIFLENNSNGQWLWLEQLTGVPLHEHLLKLLMGGIAG